MNTPSQIYTLSEARRLDKGCPIPFAKYASSPIQFKNICTLLRRRVKSERLIRSACVWFVREEVVTEWLAPKDPRTRQHRTTRR